MAFLRTQWARFGALHIAARIGIVAVVVFGLGMYAYGAYMRGPGRNQPAPPVAGAPGGPGSSGTLPPAIGPPPTDYCLGGWPYEFDRVWTHVHTVISTPPNFAKGKNIFKLGEYDHATAGDPKVIIEAARQRGLSVWTADHGEVISHGSWLRLGDMGSQGFEWTNGGIFGSQTVDHIAVYGSQGYAGVRNGLGGDNWIGTVCSDLQSFYDWLDQLAGKWVGVFCHPMEGNSQFGDFAESGSEVVNGRMAGIGVGGGLKPSWQQNLDAGEAMLRRALAAGWRLAPVYEVDNFGSPQNIPGGTNRYTGMWVERGLTGVRAGQIDALLDRRAFACTQPMAIRFAGVNTSEENQWHPMGSAVKDPADGDTIQLQFFVARYGNTPNLKLWFDVMAVKQDGSWRQIARYDGATVTMLTDPITNMAGPTGILSVVKESGDICYYLAVRREMLGKIGPCIGLSAPIFVDGRQFTRPETIPPSASGTAGSAGGGRRGRDNWRQFSIQPNEKTSVMVGAGRTRRFYFYRSGAKAVAARISLGSSPALREVEFEGNRDHSSEEWSYTNQSGSPVRVYIEGFAQDDNGWKRIDKTRYEPSGEMEFFGFEDSNDTDYNDLRVEAGSSN